MFRTLQYSILAIATLAAVLLAYGAKGYLDAALNAESLRHRAEELIAKGRGSADLGPERLEQLLRIEDPAFRKHIGVDFSTAGAGATTISQSVSKRLAFKQFRPGIGKIRQTGYALGLEQNLTKDQILGLWLDTLEMGRGPDGWMTGFFATSETIYGHPPAGVTETEFLTLVAVLIAPGSFDLWGHDPDLAVRVGRIRRLLADECAPRDHGDIWLEGCA